MAGLQVEDAAIITKDLPYRPPYQWDRLLGFLEGRAIDGVEVIRDRSYWRVVREDTKEGQALTGWIRVSDQPSGNHLRLSLPENLLTVLPQVERKVSRMFDIDCDPKAIYDHLRSMNEIKAGLCVPGTRVPGTYDVFEMCVRAILGQQITVKAARTLASRLASFFGETVETGIEGLTHAFPHIHSILELEDTVSDTLGPLGVMGQRSRTIFALAELIRDGVLDPESAQEAESRIETLMKVKGIGPWTAQYLAMRALKWPDAFPATDYGVKKVLEPRTQDEIRKLSDTWRPWRAYATINIWNSR